MAGVATVRYLPPPGCSVWPHASTWQAPEWTHWLGQKGWSAEQISQYLEDRQTYGLGVKKGREMTWLYQPAPNQVVFHKADVKNLLFGGAAGGMKSYAMRWDAHKRGLGLPGCRMLLLRRKFTELQDNHLDAAQREVQAMQDLGLNVVYNKDEKRVTYHHGKGRPDSWLRFGHCEREGDEVQYLSSEYEAIYPDEMGTFSQRQVLGVASRLRSAIPGVKPLLKGGSNPGGAQTLWLKRQFIDKIVSPEDDPGYNPREWGFLPSMLYDNPYLMDEDGTWTTYATRLVAYGPEKARQLLEGDWSAIEGQFFHEWRESTHVKSLTVTPDTEWFRCMDWGYHAPGVCYWIACLADGRYYVAQEYVFRETLATDVALEIQRLTRMLGDELGGKPLIRYTAADPSMWNRSGQVGESLAETIVRAGVPLRKAQNERVLGWARVRHLLALRPDGQGGHTPSLLVSPSCTYLRQTLPTLVYDETNQEDLDTKGPDHGLDAVRYGVMSRPSPTMVRVSTTPPPGSMGELRRQVEREGSRRRAA